MSASKSTEKTAAAGQTPKSGSSVATWRVRSDSGEVFGPADQATLQGWAREGRIAPGHTLSRDGRQWIPASELSPLELDWIAEITPGAFYGPVHRDNIEGMQQDGELPQESATYCRRPLNGQDPRSEAASLRQRMSEQQQDFDRRMQATDTERHSLRREIETLRADLKAKDYEFEAERQEFKAAQTRQEAERLKRDAALKALNQELVALRDAVKGRHALEARLTDVEAQTETERQQLQAEGQKWRTTAETRRNELLAARKMHADAQDAVATLEKRLSVETGDLRQTLESMRLRDRSVRQLLQQALSETAAADPIVIDADTAAQAPQTAPETVSRPLTETRQAARSNAGTLAGIEAQAQRELRELHSRGGSMQAFLKRHAGRRVDAR